MCCIRIDIKWWSDHRIDGGNMEFFTAHVTCSQLGPASLTVAPPLWATHAVEHFRLAALNAHVLFLSWREATGLFLLLLLLLAFLAPATTVFVLCKILSLHYTTVNTTSFRQLQLFVTVLLGGSDSDRTFFISQRTTLVELFVSKYYYSIYWVKLENKTSALASIERLYVITCNAFDSSFLSYEWCEWRLLGYNIKKC